MKQRVESGESPTGISRQVKKRRFCIYCGDEIDNVQSWQFSHPEYRQNKKKKFPFARKQSQMTKGGNTSSFCIPTQLAKTVRKIADERQQTYVLAMEELILEKIAKDQHWKKVYDEITKAN